MDHGSFWTKSFQKQKLRNTSQAKEKTAFKLKPPSYKNLNKARNFLFRLKPRYQVHGVQMCVIMTALSIILARDVYRLRDRDYQTRLQNDYLLCLVVRNMTYRDCKRAHTVSMDLYHSLDFCTWKLCDSEVGP